MSITMREGAVVHVVGADGSRTLLGRTVGEMVLARAGAPVVMPRVDSARLSFDVETDLYAKLAEAIKGREASYEVVYPCERRQKKRPQPSPHKCERRRNANKQARVARRRNRK